MILQNLLFKKRKSLDGGGLRVDLIYNNINVKNIDIYQKSHYFRYLFASNYILENSICGDFACGTGYGSAMLSKNAQRVVGIDNDKNVIKEIKNRYRSLINIDFIEANLLQIDYQSFFDYIVSFETLEHFNVVDIPKLLKIYHRALKPGGEVIFSVPYRQKPTTVSKKLGFHLSYQINKEKIEDWLNKTGFLKKFYKYQNYQTHIVTDDCPSKDFIICVAQRKDE